MCRKQSKSKDLAFRFLRKNPSLRDGFRVCETDFQVTALLELAGFCEEC